MISEPAQLQSLIARMSAANSGEMRPIPEENESIYSDDPRSIVDRQIPPKATLRSMEIREPSPDSLGVHALTNSLQSPQAGSGFLKSGAKGPSQQEVLDSSALLRPNPSRRISLTEMSLPKLNAPNTKQPYILHLPGKTRSGGYNSNASYDDSGAMDRSQDQSMEEHSKDPLEARRPYDSAPRAPNSGYSAPLVQNLRAAFDSTTGAEVSNGKEVDGLRSWGVEEVNGKEVDGLKGWGNEGLNGYSISPSPPSPTPPLPPTPATPIPPEYSSFPDETPITPLTSLTPPALSDPEKRKPIRGNSVEHARHDRHDRTPESKEDHPSGEEAGTKSGRLSLSTIQDFKRAKTKKPIIPPARGSHKPLGSSKPGSKTEPKNIENLMASLLGKGTTEKKEEIEAKNQTNKQIAELFASINQKENPFKKPKAKKEATEKSSLSKS